MPTDFVTLPTSTPATTTETSITSQLTIESQAPVESLADQTSFDQLMNSYEHNILSETFYNTEDKKKPDASKTSVDIGVARGLVLNGVASSA